MDEHNPLENAENPFCARRLRPGAAAFLFTPGQTAEQLAEQLRRNGWRGQIVGPHGSGKSALLASLLAAIERAGRATRCVTLHDGQRRLPPGLPAAVDLGRPVVLAIDGYEQLGGCNRFRLKWLCRRRGWGLVVTSHRPAGFPELFRAAVDVPLAWRVAEQLQQGFPALVAREDVAERLRCRDGNLREALFDLYDLYERRRHGGET